MAKSFYQYILCYLILLVFVLTGGIIQAAGAFFVPEWLLQPLILSGAGKPVCCALHLDFNVVSRSNTTKLCLGLSVVKISSICARKPWLAFLSKWVVLLCMNLAVVGVVVFYMDMFPCRDLKIIKMPTISIFALLFALCQVVPLKLDSYSSLPFAISTLL